ncbi:pyridoxamine 5'-phosphate oxidase family protein [Paenibacillus sacheonensis]|uniref:Flavin-nucleotide-binding protein n=1 Tax=Paenibacillus sacheonensis TaxID=742054 RepID=A0A7X5C3U2_9BACL|nr:pyridoxamine 5'-phosphate oxidase family protein [Paenibacillus sacheonensis]MBM7566735.1 nitroimidazol reductase NimA-like FMN-containing flavoprotein (pyridoxamine 5'-phosphate oxidase superfamily) [Paenibacillus sacheonensis]NBC71689.1 flavin-nucleotide-binding protein [Paenibacillus sacheonensis]
MRRAEFEINEDQEEITSFLEEMSFGFLGTATPDGEPSMTPLNFVYVGGSIYFHGSRIGEKMTQLKKNQRVTFMAAKEYAVIPSYFSDPLMACPATAYFKSVRVDGHAVVVDDPAEKAAALEALMRKLQPEGGYKEIDSEDPDYIPRLKGVAVVRIDADRVIGKFKFGQNLKQPDRESITAQLAERGLPQDAETIALMNRYCPHAKEATGE